MSTTTRSAPKTKQSHDAEAVVGWTFAGSLALAAVTYVGEVANFSCTWGAGIAIGGSWPIWSSVLAVPTPAPRSCSGSASGPPGGGWATWMLEGQHTIWCKPGLASLAVGAAAAGFLSTEFGHVDETKEEKAPSEALVLGRTARGSSVWEERFRRRCKVAVEVTRIRDWDNGFGYDVYGTILAGSGGTLKQIEARADQLATEADLPEGCGIEFASNGSRAKFIMRVSTENRLQASIPFPEDFTQSSIYDDQSLGECRNSDPADINLRENSAVVIGQKRSGKTNVLDVITARIGLCRDALPLHIDLNGGGISQLWLDPWLKGETERPAIDWAAADALEALYISEVLLRIAKHRKTAYREYKVATNSKLLKLTELLPALVPIVDEGAESMGTGANNDDVLRRLKANLEEIQRIAGNEGINPLPSGLRATNDVLSTSVLAQCAVASACACRTRRSWPTCSGGSTARPSTPPTCLMGTPARAAGFTRTAAGHHGRSRRTSWTPTGSSGSRSRLRTCYANSTRSPARSPTPSSRSTWKTGNPHRRGEPVLHPVRARAQGLHQRRRWRSQHHGISRGGRVGAHRPARAAPVPPVFTAPQPATFVDLSDPRNWPSLASFTGGAATATLEAPPQTADRPYRRSSSRRSPHSMRRVLAGCIPKPWPRPSASPRRASSRSCSARSRSWTLPNKFVRAPLGERRGYAREAFAEAAARVARDEIEVPDAVAEWPTAA